MFLVVFVCFWFYNGRCDLILVNHHVCHENNNWVIVVISIYLLIPLSLMLFVVGIWAIYYAVKSNQFEDLDNAPDQIILDDRQSRRQIETSDTPVNK